MSLVSDALRKARQYATARDIQRHGAAAGTFTPPPRRSRLGLGLLLGAAIALAAAAAGAVFVLWALRDAAAGRDPASTVGQREIAPPPAPTAPGPASTAPVHGESAARLEQAPAPGATASASASARNEIPTGREPAPAEPAGPAAGEADAPTGERVYVLRADLGYATLQLDFLVYKPSGGFGRINGQDVASGTIVDGFTVEEIGPDYIRLRDARGAVVLRTR